MGRLNLDAIPDKQPRRMADLFAMLEPDDRELILEVARSDSKSIEAVREQVEAMYPELPRFELKSWKNWANNYRSGRTVG